MKCVSVFLCSFSFFFVFYSVKKKKPYCCKDYNLDWDLNVFISAWCIYEPLQTLSVFSPQRVHRCTSGGAIFHGAPPLIAVAASSTDSSGLCLSKVGWGQRGYCYHHARPLKGGCTVHKVCWLTIIPSLSSFFLKSPWGGDCQPLVNNAAFVMDYQDWENQSRASLCQAACVPVLVFMCLCVYVCVRVGLSSSI